MANEIKVGKNETIDSALRRFKRMSQKAGTLAEVESASTMRSQVYAVRRSLRQPASASSVHKTRLITKHNKTTVIRSCGFLLYTFLGKLLKCGKDKVSLALNGVLSHIGWQEYALAGFHRKLFSLVSQHQISL